MASPLSTRNHSGMNQRFSLLNPNAQSFWPEQKVIFPTIIGFSHPPPLPLLPSPFQSWQPVVSRFYDLSTYGYPLELAGPYGSYGSELYDTCSQPQPVYEVSDSVGCFGNDCEVETVAEKLRGLALHETALGCGAKVDKRPRGRLLRPRFSRRKPTVSLRGKLWMPKKGLKNSDMCASDGNSVGGVGVSRSASKDMDDQFRRVASYKKSGGFGRIIPFPGMLEEVVSTDRTTVMIKNIPNQFKRDDLIAILDKHCEDENIKSESRTCKSAYDFVYLPMDFMKSWYQRKISNLGYAFVNFTNAVAAFKFFNSFHKHVWMVAENSKTCEVTLAELQGKEALINSFKNRLFWCDRHSFLPVVLHPPRDGSNDSVATTVGVLVARVPPRRLRKCS
ncbi:hypothetical protein F2P56_035118 [Juglans regia]|uniref:Mei2-like C-terminal RNA recognition motif domain-containing protein n=2 Tax=Juglans regia TaxID=51240 RepID=A0A833WSG8_JUGRE|nr:uncharacterized protein LOC109012521 [Juglans regia]KAF5442464.1 hypothetical protein F2P56_035118 [Juglans regia]